jgi:hypothetical protein
MVLLHGNAHPGIMVFIEHVNMLKHFNRTNGTPWIIPSPPPHSPKLVTSDFLLFEAPKQRLGGKQSQNYYNEEAVVKTV